MKRKLYTAITLSSLITISMHLINKFVCSSSTIYNKLTVPSNHYYEWRFGKIRYTKTGSGQPVLLVHDLTMGSSQYEFSELIKSLAKEHEVYAIDLLGYGLSDKPGITYTNYFYVELLNDFIKNIIGKKTDIIATGDSAPICIMACHNDSNIINKMVFINPQSLYLLNLIPSKHTKLLKFLMELPIIGVFIFNLVNSKKTLTEEFKEHYFYNGDNVKEETIRAYLESARLDNSSSRFSFASYIGKYTNTNIIHALKEINNSIYIIAGDKVEDIHSIVENYIYYNKSIESSFVPNTKHLPQLEAPQETLKQIKLFLD